MSGNIDAKIKDNRVMIFIRTTCPFCIRAKQLLDGKGIIYAEMVVDDKIKSVLTKKTKSSTVPQVFIDGVFKGGCDELYKLDKNKGLDHLPTK